MDSVKYEEIYLYMPIKLQFKIHYVIEKQCLRRLLKKKRKAENYGHSDETGIYFPQIQIEIMCS